MSSGFHQLSCVWSACGLMEKKDEMCISFSTSGTVVPAGPLYAACRECVAFGVLYLSAMAGMAWWLLAICGITATGGCLLPMLALPDSYFLSKHSALAKTSFQSQSQKLTYISLVWPPASASVLQGEDGSAQTLVRFLIWVTSVKSN